MSPVEPEAGAPTVHPVGPTLKEYVGVLEGVAQVISWAKEVVAEATGAGR